MPFSCPALQLCLLSTVYFLNAIVLVALCASIFMEYFYSRRVHHIYTYIQGYTCCAHSKAYTISKCILRLQNLFICENINKRINKNPRNRNNLGNKRIPQTSPLLWTKVTRDRYNFRRILHRAVLSCICRVAQS